MLKTISLIKGANMLDSIPPAQLVLAFQFALYVFAVIEEKNSPGILQQEGFLWLFPIIVFFGVSQKAVLNHWIDFLAAMKLKGP